MNNEFSFLIYRTENKDVSVNAIIKDETVWLTQKAMSELFDCSPDNISLHLKNIYADGELTQALIHPRHQVEKEYLVQVKGIPSEEKLDRLRAGIRLEDGVTAPVEVRLQEVLHEKNRSVLTVVLREGRNRQVRRMFDAIGFPVWSLKRIRFAFLTLQGVRRGKWRHLTTEEVADLYQFKPE